jgi:Glycosyltransferase family 87
VAKDTASKRAPVNYWPERVFALLIAGFFTFALLHGYSVRTSIVGGTDFKTVYASAWNLRHSLDAFRFENVTAVLRANGVTPPPTAYGHNAVYPPFTLALLVPITFIPLIPAVKLWAFAGCVAFSIALSALAQTAGEEFALGRGGRFLLIFFAVAYPVFTYATITQNVSLMASALALLAITGDDRTWLRSAGLAVALLLKPHLAIWPALSLLLLPEKNGRRVAAQAVLICFAVIALGGLWMAFDHQLVLQMQSYLAALRAEVGSGSMSPTQRDVIPAGLQITALSSLVGFWQTNPAAINGICWTLLAGVATILLWSTIRIGRLAEPVLARSRLIVAGAWCSFGMIATYHRAHDGLILLVLFPWIFANLKPSSSSQPVLAWPTLAFLMLTGAIIPNGLIHLSNASDTVKQLALYRQASLCGTALTAVLATQMTLLARRTNARA